MQKSPCEELEENFYKLAIGGEYVDKSASLLGCISALYVNIEKNCQFYTSTNGDNETIEETSIVVKVNKDDAVNDSVSFFDARDANSEQGFLKVTATYEQIDCLTYLHKKGIIELVANFHDLINQPKHKILVFLNEVGFTAVPIPSEDPSMGRSYKTMKILMQWLCCPLMPEEESQPTKQYDDKIEAIFSALKSKTQCPSQLTTSTDDCILQSKPKVMNDVDLDKLQHPSLVPMLREYQKRAVNWMIQQETKTSPGVETEVPHPLWKTINLGGDKQASYNPHTGRICRDLIFHQGYPSGGILADEMGLGKTVEVLACILNNPSPSETIKIECEEMSKCDCPSYSPSSSHGNNEKDVFVKYPDDAQADSKQHSLNQSKTGAADEEQKQPFQLSQNKENQLPKIIDDAGVNSMSLQSNSPSATIINIESSNSSQSVAGQSNIQLEIDEKHQVGESIKRCLPLDPQENAERFGKKARTEISTVKLSNSVIVSATGDQEKIEEIKEEEKAVRCICGKNKAGPQEEILTCINCSLSQHPKCVGLTKVTDENYVCPDCSVKMPLLESTTTLIVSPVTIAHQWLDEIHRHILPGSLNVMVYEGVAKQGFVYPTVLAENDIILTTYEVLKRDFHHLPSRKDNHNYRRPKRYPTWPCPLTCIKFWRICLDEAQMVENTTAKTTETALNLSTVHRWCITGTPIQKTVDDLFGLFLFLGVEPYYRRTWWKKILYEPFLRGNIKPLSDVLRNVMWRSAKKDVVNEINLPEQKESMNWLHFSPIENHFYRLQYEECSTFAFTELNKFQESDTDLNSLDRYSVHRMLWPLLKLRQACCHPQAVRGGNYHAVQKNVITMDQLLDSMINKAKIETQDAHRQLLCALNGLAGTYILQEKWQDSIDVYREAITSWKEHEELFKTDSLQKLHTLHNLNEMLRKVESKTKTLRDDFLEQEASEIRDKYLQRWKTRLVNAEKDASNAQEIHNELKQKVDFKCPWWMTFLQNTIANQFDSERLVEKVKADLTAVSNVHELNMADSFSDLRGLQFLLVQKFEAIEDCQNNLFNELKSLMVEPTKEMVASAAECCLRPLTNSTAERCCFCQVNDVMSSYESLIFGHQGINTDDAESIGGLRAETAAVRILKSIYAFLKAESKRHYKYYIELQRQAQCHLEYLEQVKKNFKVYRQLWHALRQRVLALDELAMCTMRLRLRYPGEAVQDDQFYIIDQTQIKIAETGFRSDKTLANSSLRKCMGQLLYLKNLAKTQSTDGGENSELCPVCTKILGYQWSVFSCGHCLCCTCMWVLLERPGLSGGRAGSHVKCPMCRTNTMVQDISYVTTIRQLTEEDKDLIVKGSHSTKIEAAVRTLMKIQKRDPKAKTLVFSTWQDVLDVIARALSENKMKFRSIKKSKDYELGLEEFKTSDDISVLLIPLQSGSNGLNIIEATHVILVEPSLNPSLERQAVGRIHRIGQTKPTFVHRLLIANTVEENITRFLQDKADTGLKCGTRKTDGENIPLTIGELALFFQPAESQIQI